MAVVQKLQNFGESVSFLLSVVAQWYVVASILNNKVKINIYGKISRQRTGKMCFHLGIVNEKLLQRYFYEILVKLVEDMKML